MYQTMQPQGNDYIPEEDEEFDREAILEQLQNDMELIGEVNLDEEGRLSFKDFCSIYKLKRKYTNEKKYPPLLKKIDERREYLRNGDDAAYKELIQECNDMEEQIMEWIDDFVNNFFRISQEQFQDSFTVVQENPESFQRVQE